MSNRSKGLTDMETVWSWIKEEGDGGKMRKTGETERERCWPHPSMDNRSARMAGAPQG